MPDTCFCPRCLAGFARASGIILPELPTAGISSWLLTEQRNAWVDWRCSVFTDWVREFREIIARERPGALLGTFHCPWSEEEYGGALRAKLAIDLKAQSAYLDVFSPMPYHARFGHGEDPAWIMRQVGWLGQHLGITGAPDERQKIWPIVQLADWGEPVPANQVETVLKYGSRLPAAGITVFAWNGLQGQPDKQEALARFYRRKKGESQSYSANHAH
jgi:hypothetical protein